ncbi:ABC transporter permease [Pseudonocardia xinjiangensis]|uniref:ABC transporter permease n=1 Tax=Pseudonocardia xinjiangensis TaxID=75289 RepID=UPI003D8E4252
MTRYVAGRLLQAVVVVLIVTVIVFALLHSLPGGPARAILGIDATPAQMADFNHQQGFDQPLVVQYLQYLGRLLHGDLGRSFALNQDVSAVVAQRLPKTLLLTGVSTLVAMAVAVPLGVWQAVRRNRAGDYVVTALTFLAYSTPAFFLAFLAILLFSQAIPLFPAQAPQADTLAGILAEPAALVLPVATGAVTAIASFSRYMRSSTLDNLAEDYVRTARAKGTVERRVIWRHVGRNSLTPVITMLGYHIPVLFGGALVTESIFNYPGMGLAFWNAAQVSDYPVLLGVVLVIATATVIGSLLADLLQALIDPRVRGAHR